MRLESSAGLQDKGPKSKLHNARPPLTSVPRHQGERLIDLWRKRVRGLVQTLVKLLATCCYAQYRIL